jgi:galactonate dehydratase
MKVTGIQAIPCRGRWMNWTFVKVTTDSGLVGWGDCTEWVRVQGHIAAMGYLAGLVIGEDPMNIEKIWQKMWVASYAGGKDVNVAMCGIETALRDIVGKTYGVPVYTMLGGKCFDRIRLYYDYCDKYLEGMQGTTTWHDGDGSLEGVA